LCRLMVDRDELIREIADHLVEQVQLVGPTPKVSERLADAEDQSRETGEISGGNWKALLEAKSRPDSQRGPRPSATMDWVVIEHLEFLNSFGKNLDIEPNRWDMENDGCGIVAEAMNIARQELIARGKEPNHVRLPLTHKAVRKIWDRRRKLKSGI
jgi:hypothetical protein